MCGYIKLLTSYFCVKDDSIMQNEFVQSDKKKLDSRIVKIAAKIKQMRIDCGYKSYETFAYDHDLNRVQYWRIEKGANITIKTLLTILDIHKISLADFFNDID